MTFMTVYIADAHAHIQGLVVKIMTVLEGYNTEEQLSVLEKGLSAKDIHKEMFPVYGGKCLSRKAFHSWV
jgi:hypothetical protein